MQPHTCFLSPERPRLSSLNSSMRLSSSSARAWRRPHHLAAFPRSRGLASRVLVHISRYEQVQQMRLTINFMLQATPTTRYRGRAGLQYLPCFSPLFNPFLTTIQVFCAIRDLTSQYREVHWVLSLLWLPLWLKLVQQVYAANPEQ
jgi:hypothetical protein